MNINCSMKLTLCCHYSNWRSNNGNRVTSLLEQRFSSEREITLYLMCEDIIATCSYSSILGTVNVKRVTN